MQRSRLTLAAGGGGGGGGGLVMGSALLSGCGFTPLYATPGMTPSLSAIDVVVPPEPGWIPAARTA